MESEKLKVVVLGGLEVWMFGGWNVFLSQSTQRAQRVFLVWVWRFVPRYIPHARIPGRIFFLSQSTLRAQSFFVGGLKSLRLAEGRPGRERDSKHWARILGRAFFLSQSTQGAQSFFSMGLEVWEAVFYWGSTGRERDSKHG